MSCLCKYICIPLCPLMNLEKRSNSIHKYKNYSESRVICCTISYNSVNSITYMSYVRYNVSVRREGVRVLQSYNIINKITMIDEQAI